MKRFRFKLTFIFILILALTAVGLGLFTVKNLKDTHIESLQESMLKQIKLVLVTVSWPQEGSIEEQRQYFEVLADDLKENADTRVTFIDNDGVVLGDSDHQADKMDNHASRPEIADALNTYGTGYSIRYSDTVEQEMLYVAHVVQRGGQHIGYLRMSMTLESVEEAIRQLWSYYMIGLIVLFLFSVLISYRVAKSLTKPLEHITRVAQHITNANYYSRVHIKNKDEIGELGDAINTMANSLQSQMYRIADNESRLNTVLENLISGVIMIDREGKVVLMNKFAEQTLGISIANLMGKSFESARSQQFEFIDMVRRSVGKKEHTRNELSIYYPEERILDINIVPLSQEKETGAVIVMHDITAIRRLERMRSEFVANVSHELKTPIASVKGFAETLLSGAVNDKDTANSFLQIIYDESERLNRLVIDILELSKIESKQSPLQFSPIHLHEFTKKSLQMMESEAKKKQIELEMDVPHDLFIEADEDRLQQVFINLISNGINYTSENGRVKIEACGLSLSEDASEDKIRIRIIDSGMGIPKKDLPRIFERFYRVDKARSRRSGGTGLGLSIVKHIVELHYGDISIDSEVGIGTTFTIDLPVIQ